MALCPHCKEREKAEGYSYCIPCRRAYNNAYSRKRSLIGSGVSSYDLHLKIKKLEAEILRLRGLLAWAQINPDAE